MDWYDDGISSDLVRAALEDFLSAEDRNEWVVDCCYAAIGVVAATVDESAREKILRTDDELEFPELVELNEIRGLACRCMSEIVFANGAESRSHDPDWLSWMQCLGDALGVPEGPLGGSWLEHQDKAGDAGSDEEVIRSCGVVRVSRGPTGLALPLTDAAVRDWGLRVGDVVDIWAGDAAWDCQLNRQTRVDPMARDEQTLALIDAISNLKPARRGKAANSGEEATGSPQAHGDVSLIDGRVALVLTHENLTRLRLEFSESDSVELGHRRNQSSGWLRRVETS